MYDAVPKEKQTAYQRWELNSFGDDRRSQQAPQPIPVAVPIGPSPAEIAALNLQLEALRETARQDGYAAGIQEGHGQGLAEGRKEAEDELSQLKKLSETFAAEVSRANEVIAEDLLNLALDLAKAMLKTVLEVKPDLVLPIVGEAIRYLPSLQQPAVLFLHPEDASIVKQHMDDELTKAGWRIALDTRIERGGCQIETGSNQIDASVGSRWERIAASLGKELSWIP